VKEEGIGEEGTSEVKEQGIGEGGTSEVKEQGIGEGGASEVKEQGTGEGKGEGGASETKTKYDELEEELIEGQEQGSTVNGTSERKFENGKEEKEGEQVGPLLTGTADGRKLKTKNLVPLVISALNGETAPGTPGPKPRRQRRRHLTLGPGGSNTPRAQHYQEVSRSIIATQLSPNTPIGALSSSNTEFDLTQVSSRGLRRRMSEFQGQSSPNMFSSGLSTPKRHTLGIGRTFSSEALECEDKAKPTEQEADSADGATRKCVSEPKELAVDDSEVKHSEHVDGNARLRSCAHRAKHSRKNHLPEW
jgi:hypothetical protein